jgi:hypothetical protein
MRNINLPKTQIHVVCGALVRPLLAPEHRHRAHGICRLPKGYTLLQPFEKITPGCKFTRPTSPKWMECMVGETHHAYDPKAYFIHARPNNATQTTPESKPNE